MSNSDLAQVLEDAITRAFTYTDDYRKFTSLRDQIRVLADTLKNTPNKEKA